MANDQLMTAWRAVSKRLVQEGYAQEDVSATMLDVALHDLIDNLGCDEAGARVLAAMRGINAPVRFAEAA